MSAQMQISLLDEGGLDLHTGLTSAYTSKPLDGQWMKKKEQEASVTTQDSDVNAQVLQNKDHNGYKRVYDCPVCLKRFGAPSKLKRHCLIHTNQRPFQCSICCRAFRERSHLKAHIRTHTKPSSPDAAKEIFPVSKSSDRLCTLQLKKKSGYQCEICLKEFSFPSKLTRHLFVHFDDKSYTCTICRKSFKQAYYLHKHLKVHTGKRNGNSWLCRVPQKHGVKSPTPEVLDNDVCLTPILDSLKNKMHEKSKCRSKLSQYVPLTETNSSTVEIKSSEVQITTSRPIDLKHTHKGVNQCSICLKSFPYPSKLARHIVSHTDIRPFKCHMCLKSFQFRWHLQCHVRIHKQKGQNIIAGHLEQNRSVSFSNAAKSEEQDVQISLQDGAEDSATVLQDTVKENMINQKMISESDVHFLLNEGRLDLPTETKPPEGQWMEEESAKEQEASITTQNEDNVKVLQSMNSNGNKRVYDCPVCHKRFGAPSKLKRHCLIHTNQRPFQCSICCRAFRERSHLKVHIRTHNIPVKSRTQPLQRYKDSSEPCNRTSKSRLESSPRYPTVQNNARSTGKQQSTVQQNENMITESVASQIMSGDYSESDIYLQDSLLNKGVSSEYSSSSSDGQWMEEIQESEEEQEASVTTQTDNDVNVRQSKNFNRSKRVYDCPVCHKQFGAPSKLKRHCLIHTNQRPFQCSICCRAFRERSHLKAHFRTHTKPVKSRTQPLQSYRDHSVPCIRISNSKLKPSPKQPTAQDYTKSTVHQDQNMVTENMASRKISVDCNDSSVYLQDYLLNEGGWDIHTGLSSACASKPPEGQWMEENQETEEKQEASVTTQDEDNDVKVLQSKNSNVNKRLYDCPVCHKQFGAPSKLKRHCLIHTNQRPFQCSVCCRAFRERSHLKVHIRTHNIPVKSRTQSHQIFRDNSVLCNRASRSRLKPSPKQPTVQDYTKSTVHQDENMVMEKMASQIVSDNCRKSDAYLQDSLLNKEGLDLHTGFNSGYSSKPPEGQWMEEIQESEEEQEASVTTQTDNDVNVWQSKNSNVNKRLYDCPVCHKRFGAPSKLKRHCLIHTNQRPFQCSMCCRAFRERSHLKTHFRTHTKPVKSRTQPLQSYRDHSVLCNRTSNSKLKPSPKQTTAQHYTKSTDKQKKENQESEKEQEASVTTQDEDNDVKVLQSKNSNVNKRLYDCPVCHKQFGAPSKLKRHCLIHTNQRPFQCSMCCRAFRERSHLKAHFRTHNIPEKRRTQSHQIFRDNSVLCNRASRSRLKPSPKQSTVQDYTKSTVHQDENMVMEKMASQIVSDDRRKSDAYLQDSLLNKEGLDLHTEFNSGYSSKPPEGQWMEEIQESEEEREASVTTQTDNDVNVEVLQSKNFNRSKRVYDCPVCHKRFGAPSKLKRHCLIHTNQRPFQCSMCCRAFRERSHLKAHMRTHHIPGTQKTPSLQSFKDNRVSCKLQPSPKYVTAHNDTMSTNNQKSTTKQDQNVLTEDMSASAFENLGSVWGLTHKTDILLDGKKASDIMPFGRVSDCPPKTDSSLHHCASESRAEKKWAHHTDDIKDCVFVDSDSVVTRCAPDSYEPSSCQNQEDPDVPRLPEVVVVKLEEFNDEGECFIKSPHDLPFCPDCNKSFHTIRNLYAHNCSNRYQEEEMKKSHQCDMCFKLFNAPSKLKRHYITHTGQRPFQCTQCQKSFTQSHYLKAHMLSHR